jgi:hypothetical protein
MAKKGKKSKGEAPKVERVEKTVQPVAPTTGDQLKERLKSVSKGSLFGMLNEVQKTTPDHWQNPEKVRNMAKRFAETLKIPVNEERLNQFMKAYTDATKGGQPNADIDELVKKYGQGQVDEKTLREMKKLLKPKE